MRFVSSTNPIYADKAHDVGGGEECGGLAPPLFECVCENFSTVSGKFLCEVRRLSDLTDRVEYTFIVKIIIRILQRAQNIRSFSCIVYRLSVKIFSKHNRN
jgi:hypothetical protein